MNKLLVCSVFCGSELDSLWLNLQREFIRRTAGEFDHAVYLSHRANRELFKDCIIVGTYSQADHPSWKYWRYGRGGYEHITGLRALSAYCRQNHYSGYLILDSDAFPVAPNWEELLRYYLKRFDKRCAAAIRIENLDAFAHPSVVYTQDPYALHWGHKAGVNLLGESVTDVTCLETEFFPMIRTNRHSLHPTLASVYFSLFYHHGAGTRHLSRMRATSCGYYDHILMSPGYCDSEEILRRLQADPETFINSLTQETFQYA
jgi:hypothetical protein